MATAAAPVGASDGSTPPRGPLAGKVAVVTGASGGIGEGIARALVAQGCRVALGARRAEVLATLAAELCDAYNAGLPGGEAKEDAPVIAHATDVTKRDDVKALIAAAEANLGPVDIMVNNGES